MKSLEPGSIQMLRPDELMPLARKEEVNHPDHYGGDTPYEVIKVLEAWFTRDELIGFLKGKVIKYQARARLKGGDKDYAKARWYADYLDDFLQRVPA